MTSRFILLSRYVQTRSTSVATAGILFICLAGWGWWFLFHQDERLVGPYQILFPALAAMLLGISNWSPMPEIESVSAEPIRILGWVQQTLLLLGSIFATIWPMPDTGNVEAAVLRNTLGMTGLAWCGVWGLGARLSWLPPLTLAILTFFAGEWDQTGSYDKPVWAWSMLPGDDKAAAFFAIAALAVGGTLYSLHGERGVISKED